MEDPDVSHVLFLLCLFINDQGKGGMEDPEVSQVIFLFFFVINGKGKPGGRILQELRKT